jgi:uncharacterized protein
MYFIYQYWYYMIPGLILGIYAQIKLSAAYGKYVRIPTRNGMTGAQAARAILDHAGLNDVPIQEIGGRLTDHYDPTKKALFLSPENYEGNSIASVGVAAHETGHALQHQAAYAPLKLRMALVPITNFANMASFGLFFLGAFLSFSKFILIAIVIYAVITLFQLVTLPVEFDASRRAKEQIFRLGLVQSDERGGVSEVLSAAAMTYVAALVTAIFQLLRFVMIARDRD